MACFLIGANISSEPMQSPWPNTLEEFATHAPDIGSHNERGSMTFLKHWRINIYELFSSRFLRINEYKMILTVYYEKDMSNYVMVVFVCIHTYIHMYNSDVNWLYLLVDFSVHTLVCPKHRIRLSWAQSLKFDNKSHQYHELYRSELLGR